MTRNIIKPKDVKVGMIIRDKMGTQGVVVENKHPWGHKRLQYRGLTIMNHPDPEWYELIEEKK